MNQIKFEGCNGNLLHYICDTGALPYCKELLHCDNGFNLVPRAFSSPRSEKPLAKAAEIAPKIR